MKFKHYLTLFLIIFSTTKQLAQNDSPFIHFSTDSELIYDICFTEYGEALAIADNNTIKVYSTNSQHLLNEFEKGHQKQVLAIDISKDSSILVSGGKDSTIVIWDFMSEKLKKKLNYHKGLITSLNISPDGKKLVSGGTDNKVSLYDLENEKLIHTFSDHKEVVTSVKFSPDSKLIASASGDKLINVYELDKLKLLVSLKGHNSWVRDIAFSNDGSKLISCGDDSRVITWKISDISKPKILNNSKYGYSWILGADFNQNNKTYAVGTSQGKLLISEPGGYETKIKVPINKVLFKPNEGVYLKVVIATRGKGVIMIDSKDMKAKKN